MQTGQQLGRYTLLRRIATGGMGDVYLAAKAGPVGFGPLVALKVLKEDLSSNREFVEMLADEANISMFLNHQNIVSVLDLGEDEGRYFIAMEYVHGATAHTLVERLARRGQSLDPPLALFIASEVARALRYAHGRVDASGVPLHIVHRDVTPGNILLSVQGEVKLTDFGIARARGRVHETRAGVVKGKFGYMAPELVRGDRVDQRADVFCLGVSTYLLLTGRHPAADLTVAEAVDRFERGAVEPPSRVAMVPAALDALVAKALAPDPADRWPSAAAFGEALQDALLASPTWRARADAAQLAAVLADEIPEASSEPMDAAALARLERERPVADTAAPAHEPLAESPTQLFEGPRTDPESPLLEGPELWDTGSGPVVAASTDVSAPRADRTIAGDMARDADDDDAPDDDRTIVGMSLHDLEASAQGGPGVAPEGAIGEDGDELFDDDTFAPGALDDDSTRLGILDADVTRVGAPLGDAELAVRAEPDARTSTGLGDDSAPADDRTEVGFSVDLGVGPAAASEPSPAVAGASAPAPTPRPVPKGPKLPRVAEAALPFDGGRASTLPELGADEPLPPSRRPPAPRRQAPRAEPVASAAPRPERPAAPSGWSDDEDARRLLAARFDREGAAPPSAFAAGARVAPAAPPPPTATADAPATHRPRRSGAMAAWGAVAVVGLALVYLGVFTDLLWPRLLLESDPPGARVRVDGQLRGRTPLTVRVAPRQSHRVDFEKDGFAPAARAITGAIREGRFYPVRAELRALPTVFLSPPDAEVWLDDVNVGRGERVVLEQLPAEGPIEIEVRSAGYEPWSRVFESAAAVPLRFDVTLREKP